jgi:hypothetical protein
MAHPPMLHSPDIRDLTLHTNLREPSRDIHSGKTRHHPTLRRGDLSALPGAPVMSC